METSVNFMAKTPTKLNQKQKDLLVELVAQNVDALLGVGDSLAAKTKWVEVAERLNSIGAEKSGPKWEKVNLVF